MVLGVDGRTNHFGRTHMYHGRHLDLIKYAPVVSRNARMKRNIHYF